MLGVEPPSASHPGSRHTAMSAWSRLTSRANMFDNSWSIAQPSRRCLYPTSMQGSPIWSSPSLPAVRRDGGRAAEIVCFERRHLRWHRGRRLAAETQFFVGASVSRCLLGQLICRASRSTSDQGRACSEALVDSGAPLRCLRVFGKRPKYTSPYSPTRFRSRGISKENIRLSEGASWAVLW
jgi:hypothetical protein